VQLSIVHMGQRRVDVLLERTNVSGNHLHATHLLGNPAKPGRDRVTSPGWPTSEHGEGRPTSGPAHKNADQVRQTAVGKTTSQQLPKGRCLSSNLGIPINGQLDGEILLDDHDWIL
jgi:hypothetical protein